MSEDKNAMPKNLEEVQEKILENQREISKKLPLLGNIVWLYHNSPNQRYMFFKDIEHRLMPALMSDQFKLYLDSKTGGMPLAFVSWAYLSDEAEQAYIESQRIAPKDWHSGENLWLIDSVTPFTEGQQLFQQVYEELFQDKEVNILYPNENGALEKKTLKELSQNIAQSFGGSQDSPKH